MILYESWCWPKLHHGIGLMISRLQSRLWVLSALFRQVTSPVLQLFIISFTSIANIMLLKESCKALFQCFGFSQHLQCNLWLSAHTRLLVSIIVPSTPSGIVFIFCLYFVFMGFIVTSGNLLICDNNMFYNNLT